MTGFPTGCAVINDQFYAANGTELWRLNLNNTESTTTPYGKVGDFYTGNDIEGLTGYDNELYIIYNNSGNYTIGHVNTSDPSDTSGNYGNVGVFGTNLDSFSITSLENDSFYTVHRTNGDLYKTLLRYLVEDKRLPSSLSSPICIASIDDDLYVINRSNDHLWRIDAHNYRNGSNSTDLGDLPSGLSSPKGMVYINSNLYVVNENSNRGELWLINKDDPDSTSGDYGKIGDLPSSITNPKDITEYEGDLLVINDDELWRIDLDDPDSTSGDYGRIGTNNFPDSINPQSIVNFFGEIYVLSSSSNVTKMYRINPTDISDTSDPYGEVEG